MGGCFTYGGTGEEKNRYFGYNTKNIWQILDSTKRTPIVLCRQLSSRRGKARGCTHLQKNDRRQWPRLWANRLSDPLAGVFTESRLQLTNTNDLLALNRHYLAANEGRDAVVSADLDPSTKLVGLVRIDEGVHPRRNLHGWPKCKHRSERMYWQQCSH